MIWRNQRVNEQTKRLIVSDYRHSWPPTIPEAPQMCCRLLGGELRYWTPVSSLTANYNIFRVKLYAKNFFTVPTLV